MRKQYLIGYLIIILIMIYNIVVFADSTPKDDLDADGLPILNGPISITDAVTNAIKYLPSIKTADSDIASAKSDIKAAKAMTGLTASVTVFAGKSSAGDIITNPPNVSPSNFFVVPSKGAISGQTNLMYPLYTGGKLDAAVKSADALYKSSVSDKTVVEMDVALNVRIAYHRVLEADALLEAITAVVTESAERARVAETFFNEGKIAKYELLRSQAALADAKQQLSNAQRDDRNALVVLKSLMGISQKSVIFALAYLVFEPNDKSLDELIARAIKNRPELLSLQYKIKSVNSTIDAVSGEYKPQLYGLAMHGFTTGSEVNESSYTIGVSAGIPLIDRGLRRSKIEASKAVLESLKAEEIRLKILIQQEVCTAFNDLEAAAKNNKLSETAIEESKENYRIMKLRNAAGKAINADVMESLMFQLNATNKRIQSIHDYNIAWDKMLRAIGEPISSGEKEKDMEEKK